VLAFCLVVYGFECYGRVGGFGWMLNVLGDMQTVCLLIFVVLVTIVGIDV
jgi:hypothetical protein